MIMILNKKNLIFPLLSLFIVAIFFIFFSGSAQAQTYKITYDGKTFYTDDLSVDVEWDALGQSTRLSGPPAFYFNGNLLQYDWTPYNEYTPPANYCPSGIWIWDSNGNQVCQPTCLSYASDGSCNVYAENPYEFTTPEVYNNINLSLGDNTFSFTSDNGMADVCSMGTAWDGVYAKLKLGGSEITTDTSWSTMTGGHVIYSCDTNVRPPRDCIGFNNSYIQTVLPFCNNDCCQTYVFKTINVSLGCGDGTCDPAIGEGCATCPADCGLCASCGDGTCDRTIGENCLTCPSDCGTCCGDGNCDPSIGEDCSTCPSDCTVCACQCGPASGTTTSFKPTSGLCNGSTSSAVNGNNPWTWTCYSPSGSCTQVSCGTANVNWIEVQP